MKATLILPFALAIALASCQSAALQSSAEHGNVQQSQRIVSEQRPVNNGNTHRISVSQEPIAATSVTDDVFLIFK